MPLNKALFEKNIAGNAQASARGNNSSSPAAPRRKWGKPKSTTSSGSTESTSNTTSSRPKWGGSHLKRNKSSDDSPSEAPAYNWKTKTALKKTEPNKKSDSKHEMETVNLKKVPDKPATSTEATQEEVEEEIVEEIVEEVVEDKPASVAAEPEKEALNNSSDMNSTATATTADLTEKMEASEETLPAAANTTAPKEETKDSSSKKKKSKKSSNPFALEEHEYLKEVPEDQRTKGKFDWSGVDSVVAGVVFDKKIDKKREKLLEKLDNINKTREDALQMMRDHVAEQKAKLDESAAKVRKKMYEACQGMTYTEMVEKVKEQHEIVATLKKSNNKLRQDTQKMHVQVKNLRVNNMKLEAANEQSMAVLEQLKERKKSVDSRYEHLTKVIIPPYQERIKEMEEVVEERKLYGHNEHRTKVRYGNYIIRFIDKVDRSDQKESFKEEIWDLGKDIEGGELAELSDDDDDSDSDDEALKIEHVPVPGNLNESINLGDMTDTTAAAAAADDAKKNNSASASKEDKSLWDRYGGGGGGASNNNNSKGSLGASASSLSGTPVGKHADLLEKANRAKAKNFNGAVILSDSSSSSSDDSDDDVSVSSDDS